MAQGAEDMPSVDFTTSVNFPNVFPASVELRCTRLVALSSPPFASRSEANAMTVLLVVTSAGMR